MDETHRFIRTLVGPQETPIRECLERNAHLSAPCGSKLKKRETALVYQKISPVLLQTYLKWILNIEARCYL